MNIVETFVGSGGSHLGFSRSGFNPILLNDINEKMINTLKLNYNYDDSIYFSGSIKEITKEKFPEVYNKEIDVLIGGIVCKGFSLAGNRNPIDDRNYLYKEQLRLVAELQPKISVIENVPQLKTTFIIDKNSENEADILDLNELYKIKKSLNGQKTNKKCNLEELNLQFTKNKEKIKELELKLTKHKYKVFDDILNLYKKLNYHVFFDILTCANYGDYTSRKRLFIIAIRDDVFSSNGDFKFPEVKYQKNEWKTVYDCFSKIDYTTEDKFNVPMKHKESTIEKFKLISMGASQKGQFASRGTTKRIHKDLPVPTLVPGHSAFFIHPIEHRSLTLREGACLTGYPNDYQFFGSHTSICEQIGNSIPIKTATELAKTIKEYLNRKN